MKVFIPALVASSFALAQSAPPPALSGTWVLQNDQNTRLVINEKADSIHVQEMNGNAVKSDYTCAISGKDCAFKDEGHAAKVSLWRNGPKLVELVTRGQDIVRRRLALKEDGTELTVEVSRISPQGKDENLTFARQ